MGKKKSSKSSITDITGPITGGIINAGPGTQEFSGDINVTIQSAMSAANLPNRTRDALADEWNGYLVNKKKLSAEGGDEYRDEVIRFSKAILGHLDIPSLEVEVAELSLQRAVISFSRRAYDQSLEDLRQIIRYWPSLKFHAVSVLVRAFFLSAQCKIQQNDLPSSVTDLKEAAALAPQDAEIFLMLGKCHIRLKDDDAAIVDFSEAVRLRPEYAEARFELGRCYAKKGDFVRTESNLKEAVKETPGRIGIRHTDAFYYLALSQAHLAQHAEAVKSFRSANRLGMKRRPDAYFHQALSYAALNDHIRAIAHITNALDRKLGDDLHSQAYRCRAKSRQALGRYTEAIEDFSYVIKLHPEDAEAYFERGLCYKSIGNFQEAIDNFNWTLKNCSTHAEASYEAGACCMKLKPPDFHAAIGYSINAVNINPKESRYHFQLSQCFEEVHEFGRAIKSALKAISTSTERNHESGLYRHVAFLYGQPSRLHDDKTAVKYYSNAIRLDPRHKKTWSEKYRNDRNYIQAMRSSTLESCGCLIVLVIIAITILIFLVKVLG